MKPECRIVIVLTLLELVSTVLIGYCPVAGSQTVDQRLLERFQSEAPRDWKESKDTFVRFFEENNGWTFDWHRSISESGKLFEKSGSIKRIGMRYIAFEGVAQSSPWAETTKQAATILNPQYVAEIIRSSPDQPWVVLKLNKVPHDLESTASGIADVLKKQFPLSGNFVDPSKSTRHPYGVCPFDVFFKKSWFELDGLEFRSIREIDDSGSPLVEVKLKYQSKVANGNVIANMERFCTALFDPKQSWCLLHVESKHRFDGDSEDSKTVIDYEYRTIKGVQFCTKTTRREFSKSSEIYFEEYRDEITVAALSPAEFTLSAFGLNEPDWYVPPRPWWLYASLTGMALLLFGAVLLRYGRKLWNRN